MENRFIKYQLEFFDIQGRQKRVYIKEKSEYGSYGEYNEYQYGGNPEPITVVGWADSPLKISMQNQGDPKYQTIKSTEISFEITSRTRFEFTDMANGTDTQYLMEVWEKEDSEADWRLKHIGYVIPEIYGQPYTKPPFAVTLKATSLGLLNTIRYKKDSADEYGGEYEYGSEYDSDDLFYRGTITAFQAVKRCLDKLNYGLDIWDSTNSYEAEMSQELSPLLQTYVDQSAYIVEENGRQRALPCIQVLENILEPFGVNFFQDYGVWKIVPIELRARSRQVRVFGSAGTLKETIPDHNPQEEKIVWVDSGQRLDFLPVLRDVEILYDHQELGNMIEGGQFNEFVHTPVEGQDEDFVVPVGWALSADSDFSKIAPPSLLRSIVNESDGGPFGLAFLSAATEPGAYIEWESDSIFNGKEGDQFKVEIAWDPVDLGLTDHSVDMPFQFKIGDQYLQDTGGWTETPSNIVINDVGDGTFDIFNVTAFDVRKKEILTAPLTEFGKIRVRIFVPEDADGSNNVRVVYPYIRLIHYPQGEPEEESETFFAERDVEVYADEESLELFHGDGPTNFHKRSFLVSNEYGTELIQSANWSRGGLAGNLPTILINIIFQEYWEQSWVIQGLHRSSLLFDRWFVEFDRGYYPIAGTYNERLCEWEGEVVESLNAQIITILGIDVCREQNDDLKFTWEEWND